MTDKQPEALRLADEADTANDAGYTTAKKANAYYLCLLEDCAQMIRRLHAELETLRAGYAAARLEIESLKAQLHAAKQINAAQFGLLAASIPGSALRASHGQASSQAGEYPALVCDYCGALTPDPWHSSGMLHGKMSKHIHSCDACCRGATQPSPAAQGDALSDDAVRVPLDNLHADAAYLIGRLREGSMPYARAIEIIRERIDAAKAAIRARAAQEGKGHD